MRISYKSLISSVLAILILSACSSATSKTDEKEEETTEWITLFNGENLEGWQMYGPEPFTDRWKVVDGAIVANQGAGESNTGFNRSIMTNQQFANFEFEMEYKIAKGGNSGLMYHVIESDEFGHDFSTGPEYQILDDEFSRSETLPNKMVAASYDMYEPATTKKPNPHMQWNKVRLVYNNGRVEHWLNGEKVLEFRDDTEDWTSRKAASKWRNSPQWGASKTGHISLQDHGDEIYFRNIRIRKL